MEIFPVYDVLFNTKSREQVEYSVSKYVRIFLQINLFGMEFQIQKQSILHSIILDFVQQLLLI